MNINIKRGAELIGAVILCQAAGFLGSLVTITSPGTWYDGLVKPALNPPNAVFGPVWTTLYLLMGIALFLYWEKRPKKKQNVWKTGLYIFFIQLALNTLWSLLFFGLQRPDLALIGIGALWLAIVGSMMYFYRFSKVATWLLLPYLLWVSFASYLNVSIVFLN